MGKHFAGNEKDRETAFKCYLEAAKLDFVPAFVELGKCYRTASGTKKGPDEAFKWLEKASEANNPEGGFNLGVCYLLGEGVKTDGKKALKLFTRAADLGSPRALLALLLLQERSSFYSTFFRGNDHAANDESPNSKNSTYFCRRAICLKYGIGTEKSSDKALELLRKYSGNNRWMAFELGDSYEAEDNRARDFFKAAGAYASAAARGSVRALWRLGKLYTRLGDRNKALDCYRRAAQKGHAGAAFELGKLQLRDGIRTPASEQARAFAFFKRAAQKGYVPACLQVGDCYYKGIGVKKRSGACR